MTLTPWLPAIADFTAELKAAASIAEAGSRARALCALASHDLDFITVQSLARHIEKAGGDLAHEMPSVRLALLSSHTVSHLVPSLSVAGVRRGFVAQCHVGDYGLYRQEILEPSPSLAAFAPQVVVLALDPADCAISLAMDASRAEAEAAVEARVGELSALWRQARKHFNATIVQQTFLNWHLPLFGSYEGLVPAAPRSLVDHFNARLRAIAKDEGILLLDLDLHAANFGRSNVMDWVRWHQAKQLVSAKLAPWWADLLARVIAASRGLSKKCLVLDLDNTVWGGVVGDDGIEGIELGQGTATGESFIAFQRYAAELAARGIILAVCSKNDPAVAEEAFTKHPDMILKRDDIACFIANWDDKATNLRRIASQLNIGIDSLVFVDDNPAERAIIRRELPMVAVPELPEEPADYASRLSEAGYFEAAAFSNEDLGRASQYTANAKREAELAKATDVEGFLKSLEMTLQIGRVNKTSLGRVTQLTNKTNQFNLTTRRYTEADIEAYMRDPHVVALHFRLKDKFGDNGIISVIIARPDEAWPQGTWLIDTWLMSCRVLSRGVEAASLAFLCQAAAALGAKRLVGEYRPTAKNKMVAEHYAKLGFKPIDPPPGQAGQGVSFWSLELHETPSPTHHMEIAFDDA